VDNFSLDSSSNAGIPVTWSLMHGSRKMAIF